MSEEIVKILTDQSQAIGRIEGKLSELTNMKDDVESLKESRSHIRGYAAGFTGAFAILEIALHYFAKKLGLGS